MTTDADNKKITLIQRGTYRGLLLFAATVGALWAFFLILAPFIVPVAWALCLGAITTHPYRILAARWKKPRLSAAVMVVLTALVILGPVVFVSSMVLEEARSLDFSEAGEQIKEHFPEVMADAETWAVDNGIIKEGESLPRRIGFELKDGLPKLLSGPVAGTAVSVIMGPIVFLIGFILTLVTLYFVYIETRKLRRLVLEVSPLTESETDQILQTLRGTTSAAILGGLLVALIQGALGGIAFAIAGVQSPVLWSIVMAGASLLPFGGTALIWVPAAVYLLVTGDTWQGWFVAGWGIVIVGMSDNLLRPWLLTKTGAKNIHPLLLFFAIMSGIGLFGMSGVVFGPLLLALLTTIVQIYRHHVTQAGADPVPVAGATRGGNPPDQP